MAWQVRTSGLSQARSLLSLCLLRWGQGRPRQVRTRSPSLEGPSPSLGLVPRGAGSSGAIHIHLMISDLELQGKGMQRL